MEKKFASRISPVLVLILGAVFVPTTYLMIRDGTYLGVAINLFAAIFIVVVLAGTRYAITGDSLHIHVIFLVNIHIPVVDIHRIERSYNPIASPAGSLKRLAVHYGERSTLISPKNEADFIRTLKSLNPQIQVTL
ncbi:MULTISPECIES: PH domain-containing protein [Robiginitalea]|uniref:PH domain-containing protein n=1 Tax=Robiginitalea TaxID=252306 RepID=UPI00234938C0|nr:MULTISPECIES: PH domain-containing protein [unclassified Robiginitalea]MDC6354793.1 PH domain-containing protein [Robiginitalea sp. PM2]MDC6375059.1 PH domain-containing protein [Robiginitalea sp. SP8]